MPTTLLAIDDSVTMRKVLEITFAGEDFRVITADSADAGFAKLRSDRPAVVLCDVTLDGPGGYAVCAKIKTENPTVAVVLMASKQQPYDAHKGQSARADDFIEKPFDTQQLIDKVKKLATRPAEAAAPAAAVRPPTAPMSIGPATQPGVAPMGGVPGRPPPAPPAAAAARAAQGGPPPAPPAAPANRYGAPAGAGVASSGIGRGTLAYGAYIQNAPPAAPAAPAPAPAAAAPAPATTSGSVVARPPVAPAAPAPLVVAAAPPQPAPVAAAHAPAAPAQAIAAASATNGQLAQKLQHLGLTDAQVSAVLSLSREVIERVVWEVVPTLAETMIREELKRLTAE